MTDKNGQNKSVLVKVNTIPPSEAFRKWLKQHIPKGVKILYTQDDTKS